MKYESRIEELEKEVTRLAKTLGTFIAWSARELGHDNVIRLLDMMAKESANKKALANKSTKA